MFDLGMNHIKLLKELRAFGDSVKAVREDMAPEMMEEVLNANAYTRRTNAAVGVAYLSTLPPEELQEHLQRIAATVRAMETPAARAVMAIVEHAVTAITEKR